MFEFLIASIIWTGTATVYANEFEGNHTASIPSEIFSQNKVSGAVGCFWKNHHNKPFWVELTNVEENRKLKVWINDNCPACGCLDYDLSDKAWHLFTKKKHGRVKITSKIL